jgi:ERCC4-type nuclease
VPANKKPRFEKILTTVETLAEWEQGSPNLGEMLGMFRFLSARIEEEIQNPEVLSPIDCYDVRQRIGERILNEMMTRHRRVDHREHWTMLGYLGELGFEVVHLDTGEGDMNTRRVAIERKEDDLVPSLFDDRRLRQLSAMREEAEFSYLVVTKSYSEIKKGLQERQVSDKILTSFIASLCAVGYPPVFIGDRYDASQVIHSIVGKIEDDNHRLYIPRPKGASPNAFRDAMIEALPRIGAKTRRKLVKEFGSISGLCQASVEDMASIEGIGKATAEKIHKCLHQKNGK